MSNLLFTVSMLTESDLKLLGKVYTSDSSSFSTDDKQQIYKLLNLGLEGNILIEPTSFSKSDLDIGKEPDFINETGRKFWIYRPGEEP